VVRVERVVEVRVARSLRRDLEGVGPRRVAAGSLCTWTWVEISDGFVRGVRALFRSGILVIGHMRACSMAFSTSSSFVAWHTPKTPGASLFSRLFASVCMLLSNVVKY